MEASFILLLTRLTSPNTNLMWYSCWAVFGREPKSHAAQIRQICTAHKYEFKLSEREVRDKCVLRKRVQETVLQRTFANTL
ncbi:hypothetical protein M8J76_003961 [Diaphorina citri]|nr:hypothetical protein M8J76_003961 [Diaphorina citri]